MNELILGGIQFLSVVFYNKTNSAVLISNTSAFLFSFLPVFEVFCLKLDYIVHILSD